MCGTWTEGYAKQSLEVTRGWYSRFHKIWDLVWLGAIYKLDGEPKQTKLTQQKH
jgi:hypothetical protein